MVPNVVNAGLVAAYLLLLALVAVQYYRGVVDRRRLGTLVGLCLTWLAYGLIQVSQEGPVPTGTPLNYALDGVAVLALVAGLWLLYRSWRRRLGGSDERTDAADG